MRHRAAWLFVILSCSAICGEAHAQLLVMYQSKADDFIKKIMEHYAGIDTCRNEFNPMVALKDKDIRSENYTYRRVRDPLTPGRENHLMQWEFPGITIQAETHFSLYGPSTWLSKIELSGDSQRLDGNLTIGDSIDQFAEVLELTDRMKTTGTLVSSRANVTLHADHDGNISRLTIECVAD